MKRIIFAAAAIALLFVGCRKNGDGTQGRNFPDSIPQAEAFPVIAWHGVWAGEASEESFREAEEMGITLNYSRMGSVDNALRVLDIAAKSKVKLIVECWDLFDDAKRAGAVKRLKDHPALGGYFVHDEPTVPQFPGIARTMNEISAIDNGHIMYCNLFPNGNAALYATIGASSYSDYLNKYLSTVPARFLSFDKYPVVKVGENIVVAGDWYDALERASAAAASKDIPLWAFMLTVKHYSYPEPEESHLRLQAYGNLAYGAQALQCFTYRTPEGNLAGYYEAPIDAAGKKTVIYDRAKKVLGEVNRLAWVFTGCKMQRVMHFASEGNIPEGAAGLGGVPPIMEKFVYRGQGLVSYLKNHDYNFLLIQNTSIDKELRMDFAFKGEARRVRKDGSLAKPSEEPSSHTLEPGDCLIYMY